MGDLTAACSTGGSFAEYYRKREAAQKAFDETPRHLLQVGEVFRNAKMGDLVYGYKRDDSGGYEVDLSCLEFSSSELGFTRTQEKDGWAMRRDETLDRAHPNPQSLADSEWVVVTAVQREGGTAMGNDKYPDYWAVAFSQLDGEGNYDAAAPTVWHSQPLYGGEEFFPHRTMERTFQ